ncbi:MAG: aroma-sacti cluster domain-containing protein [Jatrophihabitantaceae bacterium]
MTDPQQALVAAFEAAGLSIQSITAAERAMFATLSDEEVTRLIELRRRSTTAASPVDGSVGSSAPADSGVAEPAGSASASADSEVAEPAGSTDPGS